MNYIILDMEWNQPLYSGMTVTEPVLLHGEVVQIGAVKLNGEADIIDTLNIFISPKYYKKMHYKVQKLTGITVDTLKNGVTFPEAARKFLDWCGEDSVILTWGPDDIPMLHSNMLLHSMDTSDVPKSYNLQVIFDAQITKEHRQVALGRALEILEETGEDAHNALNDAKNTAIVCRHLQLEDGIAAYDELHAQFLAPNASENEVCGGEYTTKREALRDTAVTEFECPICKGKVKCTVFERQNACKTISIGVCENGDEIFVRFKFTRQENGLYQIKRAIYEMNDEYREYYRQKVEANKEYRKFRKNKDVKSSV